MHSQDIAIDEAYVPIFGRQKRVVARARVDLVVAEAVASKRWYLVKGYARSSGNSTATLMHRFILGVGPGDPEVDHINRDKLDNRRTNLRLVDHATNALNQGPRPGKSYVGVHFDNYTGRWRARIRMHGRLHHIGWFDTEDEAGEAANAWTRIHIPERWQNPTF